MIGSVVRPSCISPTRGRRIPVNGYNRPYDGRSVAYAAENELDLVVRGTHGHSAVERRLLGSVTQHVAGAAAVPIVTVSAPAENVV
ncbi:MAG: hypothetical protein BRD24_07045 [Halobacteriales archaeon SW_9_67_24]|nr:MAG: hypothetical protein BRD24_07045 [Halobacteriales archaeon SW_9_67_24]